jgi:hypothetical protein
MPRRRAGSAGRVALLVLSQYVEEAYATDLLTEATSSVGYLLKDRVAHVRVPRHVIMRPAAASHLPLIV